MFYGHFCSHGRLNGPSGLQREWSWVKDETPFRYAHAEILTPVVMICGPTRYQLDHRGALSVFCAGDNEEDDDDILKYSKSYWRHIVQ